MKWVCKVCGYIYEGDELPEDYVCPLCGVGPEEFEKVKEFFCSHTFQLNMCILLMSAIEVNT